MAIRMNMDMEKKLEHLELIKGIVRQISQEDNIADTTVLAACSSIMLDIFVSWKKPFESFQAYLKNLQDNVEPKWPLG